MSHLQGGGVISAGEGQLSRGGGVSADGQGQLCRGGGVSAAERGQLSCHAALIGVCQHQDIYTLA